MRAFDRLSTVVVTVSAAPGLTSGCWPAPPRTDRRTARWLHPVRQLGLGQRIGDRRQSAGAPWPAPAAISRDAAISKARMASSISGPTAAPPGKAVPGGVDAFEEIFRRPESRPPGRMSVVARAWPPHRSRALAVVHAAAHGGQFLVGISQDWIERAGVGFAGGRQLRAAASREPAGAPREVAGGVVPGGRRSRTSAAPA
jgi:hypothetical protein